MSAKESFIYFIENLFNKLEIEFTISGMGVLSIKTEHHFISYVPLESFGNEGFKQYLLVENRNIVIWEDLWITKTNIIKSRLNYTFGISHRIPARVCSTKRINTEEASTFLELHHLQGAAGFKTKYGIFIPNQYFRLLPEFIKDKIDVSQKDLLIGVMTFSSPKKYYYDGKSIFSYELVRFAVYRGINLVGGFTKLLHYFIKEKNPGNIMTYVDAEWSGIESFTKLGFNYIEKTDPLFYGLDNNLNRVKPSKENMAKVQNGGSHKFIMTLHE